MKMVRFRKREYEALFSQYNNGNTKIELRDDVGNLITATVNTGEIIPEDQAYFRDYDDEYREVLLALREGGFVKDVLCYRDIGEILFPLCLLDLPSFNVPVIKTATDAKEKDCEYCGRRIYVYDGEHFVEGWDKLIELVNVYCPMCGREIADLDWSDL